MPIDDVRLPFPLFHIQNLFFFLLHIRGELISKKISQLFFDNQHMVRTLIR